MALVAGSVDLGVIQLHPYPPHALPLRTSPFAQDLRPFPVVCLLLCSLLRHHALFQLVCLIVFQLTLRF